MNDPVVIVGAARTPMGAFQGDMVGKKYEAGGIAKDGAKMVHEPYYLQRYHHPV